jgi:hypothetical protein
VRDKTFVLFIALFRRDGEAKKVKPPPDTLEAPGGVLLYTVLWVGLGDLKGVNIEQAAPVL